MEFNFIASDTFELNDLRDIEVFINNYPDFQTVVLNNENELLLLLKSMGIYDPTCHNLSGGDIGKFWDISKYKLPELNEFAFDLFYRNWLKLSHRENNMDEYGNLIFLNGLSKQWNELKYRLVVSY